MTDREAMQMALERLTMWLDDFPDTAVIEDRWAVEALRQALAQPEQVSIEPPDYVEPITFDYHEGWEEGFKAGVGSAKNKKESTPSNVDPLLHGGDGNYIKQAQPEQEPVAMVTGYKSGHCVIAPIGGNTIFQTGLALYTAPPKREWVGLTEREIDAIREDIFEKHQMALLTSKDITSENNYSAFNFYLAIQEKLRSKNDF